jgi:hypothetical protein
MRRRALALSAVLAATLIISAGPARADYDDDDDEDDEYHEQDRRDDHRRDWPDTEISFSIGFFEPRGQSDLWRDNEQVFTLDNEDFDAPIGAIRVGSALNNYVVVGVGAGYFDEEVRSRYQFFTDTSGNPIKHDTRLRLLPVTVDLRIMPFGRAAGHDGHGDARTVVPWLEVGGGAMLWKYREEGDFIDPVSLTIFNDKFKSRGIAPEYHGAVGVDVNFGNHFGLFVEGRVSRAKDDMGSDFDGFDKFDLSGASVSAGGRVRF